MKTIIPLNGDMGQILEGVVLDLKNVPCSMIDRLQLHFADGDSTDIPPDALSQMVGRNDFGDYDEEEITAIEVNFDLIRLEAIIEDVSRHISQIVRNELERHDNNTGNN